MLIREFIEKFEEVIPKDLQDSWDNSGVQVGNLDLELKKIFICLDVTDQVIDQAGQAGANLIIAHHPTLFKAKKSLSYDDFISKKIIDALKNDMVIYASHTAIDVNENGLNKYVFSKMGFESQGKIEVTEDPHGYGDFSNIEEESITEISERIKDNLAIDHIVYYGPLDKKVKKVGLVTGAGASFIDQVKDLAIDLFITADVKHHDAMDFVEQGISVMDLGHYQSEKLFNPLVGQIIGKIDSKIEFVLEDEQDLFKRNIL